MKTQRGTLSINDIKVSIKGLLKSLEGHIINLLEWWRVIQFKIYTCII